MSEHVATKSCSHSSEEGNKEVVLYFIGLAIFIVGLFVRINPWQEMMYLITLVVSGYHIILSGFQDTFEQSVKHKRFKPNVHILMTLAAIGAVIIGEFMEAALLILIFA